MDFSNQKFDIILQAGQSNAWGTGYGEVKNAYALDEDIYHISPWAGSETYFGDLNRVHFTTIEYGETPIQIEVAGETMTERGLRGNFALSFAKCYKQSRNLKEGRKILIVRAAFGGTGFSTGHWTNDGRFYTKMREMLDYVLGLNPENRLVAFLWHQGENEVAKSIGREQHRCVLLKLVSEIKNDYGVPSLPFIAGDFVHDWKNRNLDVCEPILNGIRDVVKEVGGEFVETEGLNSNNQIFGDKDYIHFCREALYELGKRYFIAYQKIIDRQISMNCGFIKEI